MKINIKPGYTPLTEKDYCCVPTVLQMLLDRRKIKHGSQDEIGYELGLIVPKAKAHLFTKMRIGKKPRAGWGTQISKKQYSINKYFSKHDIPLKWECYRLEDIEDIKKFIIQNLKNNNDIIVCFNSKVLFGAGDIEHVSLIQSIENSTVTLIDPAKDLPKIKKVKISKLIETLKFNKISKLGGFWVICEGRLF